MFTVRKVPLLVTEISELVIDARISAAVSYTHLDVYKRQPIHCGNGIVLD